MQGAPITHIDELSERANAVLKNRRVEGSHNIDNSKRYEKYGCDFLLCPKSESFRRRESQVCFVLKYSPRTALMASGMVSSFLDFLSSSIALSMSSDTDSQIHGSHGEVS